MPSRDTDGKAPHPASLVRRVEIHRRSGACDGRAGGRRARGTLVKQAPTAKHSVRASASRATSRLTGSRTCQPLARRAQATRACGRSVKVLAFLEVDECIPSRCAYGVFGEPEPTVPHSCCRPSGSRSVRLAFASAKVALIETRRIDPRKALTVPSGDAQGENRDGDPIGACRGAARGGPGRILMLGAGRHVARNSSISGPGGTSPSYAFRTSPWQER
jgi:hypothetical protein